MAYTPGPWVAGDHPYGAEFEVRTANDADLYITGVQWGSGAEECPYLPPYANARANARLIAAAPELLAAASDARDLLANSPAESGYCMCGDPVAGHNIGSGHAPVDSHVYVAGQVIEQLNSAIAKATPLSSMESRT